VVEVRLGGRLDRDRDRRAVKRTCQGPWYDGRSHGDIRQSYSFIGDIKLELLKRPTQEAFDELRGKRDHCVIVYKFKYSHFTI
jgi:hypothetical protein